MRWNHPALASAGLLATLLLALAAPAREAFSQDTEGEEAGEVVEEELDDEGPAPMSPSADPETLERSLMSELARIGDRVNTLKERVFRSKARLLLLEEKVIRGIATSAKAVLYHTNRLGPAYVVEQVVYYFDGSAIHEQEGSTPGNRRVKIYEGNIPAGNHSLTVSGNIRGSGLGVFTYLRDYEFKFQSTYSFVAEDGKTTEVDAVLYRVGGAAGDFTQVDLRFDMQLLDGAPTPVEGEN